eukprot:14170294-Alexandrium_andersonii.AAC.1
MELVQRASIRGAPTLQCPHDFPRRRSSCKALFRVVSLGAAGLDFAPASCDCISPPAAMYK